MESLRRTARQNHGKLDFGGIQDFIDLTLRDILREGVDAHGRRACGVRSTHLDVCVSHETIQGVGRRHDASTGSSSCRQRTPTVSHRLKRSPPPQLQLSLPQNHPPHRPSSAARNGPNPVPFPSPIENRACRSGARFYNTFSLAADRLSAVKLRSPVSHLGAIWGKRWPVKVRSSVKRICENCKLIKRHGKLLIICTNPRHKQRQG